MVEKKEERAGIFAPDDLELEEVAKILTELKADHVAKEAYTRGANTLLLASMVEDPMIAQRLRHAYLRGFERMMAKKRSTKDRG